MRADGSGRPMIGIPTSPHCITYQHSGGFISITPWGDPGHSHRSGQWLHNPQPLGELDKPCLLEHYHMG